MPTADASGLARFAQRLLDSPVALLFAGIATPTVLYGIWGAMEIVFLPIAR